MNNPDLLPPLTASIAIVADRDRYKRERDELVALLKVLRADVEYVLNRGSTNGNGHLDNASATRLIRADHDINHAIEKVQPCQR